MNIQEFFDMPEDQRQFVIDLHNKQKSIRMTRELIMNERAKLSTREFNNQQTCEHPFATKNYQAIENEFGNLTGGGYYRFHCEDCGFRWQEDK